MSSSHESEHGKLTRNLNELLQEIRVAQAGVQILFGFLLSIAFTGRYAELAAPGRIVHLIAVAFAGAAVGLLTAPAAWHRILFRQGRRSDLVRAADRLAIAGLVCLAIAVIGALVLIGLVVLGAVAAIITGSLATVGFGLLWFALPSRLRRRTPEDGLLRP